MPEFRIAREADAAELLSIYAAYIDTAITFETEIPTEAEFARRIREVQEFYPYIVAEDGGRIVGYAYAHRFRERAAYQWGAELSIYIASDAHGRGVGRALYAALLEMLLRQGVRMVYGCVGMPNPASVALHTKLGFREIGVFRNAGWKNGAWHDVLWLEKALSDGPPAPLVPIGQVDVSDILKSGSAR